MPMVNLESLMILDIVSRPGSSLESYKLGIRAQDLRVLVCLKVFPVGSYLWL